MRAAAAVLAFLAATLATAGGTGSLPPELARGDLQAWLDGYFPYALARDDIAGAAVVVVRDGAVLAARGYGHADVANGIRVDPARTLFRTGSVGKLFTWTAVMQLVEAGLLDLDRDVNDYLDFRIPARDGKPLTLRHLMTHTPGFEEAIKRLVTDRPERLATPEAYLKAWIPERIFPPGEVPAYSNYGVTLAGYLVERVSGERYDDYVDRHVFAPLGMARSTTRQVVPAHLRAHVSQGYQLASGPPQPFELFGVAPAGGATTTATDMARFMLAWLGEGELCNARILRAESVRRTLGTRLPIVPPLNAMLLGFYEQEPGGRGIAGHDGDTQFFHSALSLFVERGVGVYVVVNSTGRDGAASLLLSAFMRGFVDRYFPSPAVEGTVSAEEAAAHARLMTGTYMSSRRQDSNFFSAIGFLGQTRVRLDQDGGLLIPALVDTNGEPMKWREVQPFVWHQVHGNERLAARLKSGRIELISVDSASPFLVLQPAPWWKSSTIFLPLLVLSLAVILAAIVAWPVTALLRRHYGLWPAHAGVAGRSYRFTRIAGIGVFAVLAAWTAVFSQLSGNLFAFSPALDPWIASLRIATLSTSAGAVLLALWDAKRGWDSRGWLSRSGSVLLVLAFATLLWLATVLKLAGFGTNY